MIFLYKTFYCYWTNANTLNMWKFSVKKKFVVHHELANCFKIKKKVIVFCLFVFVICFFLTYWIYNLIFYHKKQQIFHGFIICVFYSLESLKISIELYWARNYMKFVKCMNSEKPPCINVFFLIIKLFYTREIM